MQSNLPGFVVSRSGNLEEHGSFFILTNNMPRRKGKGKQGKKGEPDLNRPGQKIIQGGVEVEYSDDLATLAADSEFDWSTFCSALFAKMVDEDLPPEQANQVVQFVEMKRKQRRDLLSKGRDDRVAKHTSKLDNNILSGLSRYELEIKYSTWPPELTLPGKETPKSP